MNEFFTKKEVKKISCLTSNYCGLASHNELTEVVKWCGGYDIIISENYRSAILSVSKEHFAMIKVMIEELERD